jgi:hypothetical protein
MASEKQYDVFRSLYDEEIERYTALESRAKLYLTIITFYLGAVVFKMEDVMKFITVFQVPLGLYLALSVVLLCALLLTVLATRIRTYEGICDPEEVIRSFGKTKPTDEEFLDHRVVDLACATNRNVAENNKVAGILQTASYLLFVSVFLQLVIFGLAIF